MKIYTYYYSRAKDLPENILPISIAGWAPKGWTGEEYKVLAPKWSFFKEYKETGDEERYTEQFTRLVLGAITREKVIQDLHSILAKYPGKDSVALLCYEKPGSFCHRHIVAEWLGEVEEYEEKKK